MNNQKTDTITYISSPEGLTAIIVASSNTVGREWYWVFTDHLGSITTLVRNSDGQKYEMSYDAWGNKRDPNTWRAFAGTAPEARFERGFTGHEHLYAFNLINMNGRFYDPGLGRMLSPDNYVQAPDFTQNFNRYSYALNNPLAYIDPTGDQYIPYTLPSLNINHYSYNSYNTLNTFNNSGDYNFSSYSSTSFSGNFSYRGYSGSFNGGNFFHSYYNSQKTSTLSGTTTNINSGIAQNSYFSFKGIGPSGESIKYEYKSNHFYNLSYSYTIPNYTPNVSELSPNPFDGGSETQFKTDILSSINEVSGWTSNIADIIYNFLATTSSGSKVGHYISISKPLIKTANSVPIISFVALGVQTTTDATLSMTGEKTWLESGFNASVSFAAFKIAAKYGGWYGIAFGMGIQSGVSYMKLLSEHPEYSPYPFHGRK
ncbi:MAG: RHS repeat-associated core domain-containing [Bacteroidetes bacterium]|nr:MAG: RHS repeat-associated core domain-containing [Bacteroidota bacterium]